MYHTKRFQYLIISVSVASTWMVCPCEADQTEASAVLLSEIPAGYTLQYYDDCGVFGRQPHVPGNTCFRFSDQAVEADAKSRTVTYGTPNFDVVYEDLDGRVPWIVAITYASERGNKRVQTLMAGEMLLHAPYELPNGKAERLILKIPSDAVQNGNLTLHFVCNAGDNAVLSVIELWAPLSAPPTVHFMANPLPSGKVIGQISDIQYEGIPDIEVIASDTATGETFGKASSATDGAFRIDLAARLKPDSSGTIDVVAKMNNGDLQCRLAKAALLFSPPKFRPIADQIAGLESPVMLLDGVWRITTSPKDDLQTEATSGLGWADFTVPGQWFQQGLDVPQDRKVGVATDFTIPASWAGKQIILRFDAIHGGVNYWLNGTRLGESENLFTPVEFDLTNTAKVGQSNHLAMTIQVQTPSEIASYSSDYAFHNLGGIDRSVRVFALPPLHLSGLHHETILDAAYHDASLVIHTSVTNAGDSPISDASLRYSLNAPDGTRIPLPEGTFHLGKLVPGETEITHRLAIANPLKWNTEEPSLYKLTVELAQPGGTLEKFVRSVGFREIAIHGSELTVNGTPVKLAGMCRHEFDPLNGRAATAKHAETDARLFKEANINFVRTSHYPPTREFLDACDRIGLYVECEAPFCWTRGRGESDPSLTGHFLIPATAMIEYHRDHASLILWSVGNESGYTAGGENCLPLNFSEMLGLVRKMDPTRPTIFNNEWNKDGGECDLACVHYPPFPVEQYEFVQNDPRPLLLDEYFPFQTFTFADELKINPGLDIVYWPAGQNSPNSYWCQIFASKQACGGAIWAGIDEEFYFADGSVKGYGPWGFVDVWRRPKSLLWDVKRFYSPVWIPMRRIGYVLGQKNIIIPVENRYSFTNLSELRAVWELGGTQGDIELKLAPRSSGEISIPIPTDTPSGSMLTLRFFDADGRLVTANGVTLGDAPLRSLPQPGTGCPQWQDDGQIVTITGKAFRLVLNRTTGELEPQENDRSVRLIGFPRLFVSRQESKNVFNPGGVTYAQYPDESSRTIDSVTVEPRGDSLAIVVKDRYAQFAGSVELVLDKEGICTASFEYQYSGEPFTVSEMGLRFPMDKSCQEIRWLRKTEWDVYPEDHIGRSEGSAMAYRDAKWGNQPLLYGRQPSWPWHLDSNEYGTRDFRAEKYQIYEASILTPDGSGLRIDSDGTVNVRACLSSNAVQFHTLLASPKSSLSSGDPFCGTFQIRLFFYNIPPKTR